MWVIRVAVVALVACPVTAALAEEPAEAESARALVERLASDSYQVRQRASERLGKLGLAARDALVEGLEHPDPEVRYRCRRILAKVLDDDFQARLAAFARSPEGTEHDLPGWERYRKLAGDDPPARKLFAEMLGDEGGLIESAEAGAPDEALGIRLDQVYRKAYTGNRKLRQQPTRGTLAALFFVGSDPALTAEARCKANPRWFNLLRHATVRKALQQGELTGQFRALVSRWLATWPVHPVQGRTTFILALQYGLEGGLAPALKVIEEHQRYQPRILSYALLLVGKLGGRGHVEELEPLVADRRPVGARTVRGNRFETQIGDVALAVLIHLAGEDPKEYGFAHVQPNKVYLFSPNTLGFAGRADRDAARARWSRRRETLLKPDD